MALRGGRTHKRICIVKPKQEVCQERVGQPAMAETNFRHAGCPRERRVFRLRRDERERQNGQKPEEAFLRYAGLPSRRRDGVASALR